MTPPLRTTASNSALVVIDVQEKLLAKMPSGPELVRATCFLLDVATLLNVPILATEQYHKGLGPTTPEIARRLREPILAKTSFSCFGSAEFRDKLQATGCKSVILTGMETHVCVLQTALDLLATGLTVYLCVDALTSRNARDHETALQQMQAAGALVTTAETVAFEWLRDAAHPQFKAISKLVIERATPP